MNETKGTGPMRARTDQGREAQEAREQQEQADVSARSKRKPAARQDARAQGPHHKLRTNEREMIVLRPAMLAERVPKPAHEAEADGGNVTTKNEAKMRKRRRTSGRESSSGGRERRGNARRAK